jgi:hypothetical protein
MEWAPCMSTQFVELGSQHYCHVKWDSGGKWFQRLAETIAISRVRCHKQDVNVSPTRPTIEHGAEQVSCESIRDFKLSIEYRADVF